MKTGSSFQEGPTALFTTAPKGASPLMRGIGDSKPIGQRLIPKTIWQFWHDGLAGAPDVVHRSVETWRQLNPDHELKLLSLDSLNEFTGLDFELLAWIERSVDRGKILHDLNCAIYKRFAADGIQIPFPQRDLHVRTMPS